MTIAIHSRLAGTSTLSDETLQTNYGVAVGVARHSFAAHAFLRTEPSAPYLCPSATRTAETSMRTLQVWPLLWRLTDLYSTPESERWPDADWPFFAAFDDAWQFTNRLPENLKESPHISLADDGEVNFAWSGGAIYIDLGFYGDGTFSYYGRDCDGRESFGDDIPVTSPLPEELVSLLTV